MQAGKTFGRSVSGLALILLASGCTSDLQKAQKAERQGDCAQARASYIAALTRISAPHRMPDPVKAKQISPETWRNEIGEFVSSITQPKRVSSPDFDRIVQGMVSCSSSSGNENVLVGLNASKLVPESLWTRWGSMFFPEAMQAHQSHRELVDRVLQQNTSMLTLHAVGRNYTYEGFLLEAATGLLRPYTIYQESTTSLLVRPGRHLLLMRSTVSFPTKEIWRSSYSVLPFDVPDSSSLIGADVVTKVSRKG